MALVQQDRIDAGIGFQWDTLPPHRTALNDVPLDVQELRFRRERQSHRGLSRFRQLRRVWAYSVHQDFLDELAGLPDLELLYIEGLTATDLRPLAKLRRLRRLILIGGTKIENLDWTAELPPLDALAIENFKRLETLDPLGSLQSLSALAVEGSMWTAMRVASLAPVSAISNLRYLFLTNLRTSDQSLSPLHPLTNLRVLECGALFTDEEFMRLRAAIPGLRCQWFEMIDRYGTTREGIRRAVRGEI